MRRLEGQFMLLIDIYNNAFMDLFGLKPLDLNESLTYQSINAWDSVGHMELIARLESDFDIMIEMDDVIDFSSYQKGKELLQKYKVVLN